MQRFQFQRITQAVRPKRAADRRMRMMMLLAHSHLVRPLMQWPRWQHHCCSRSFHSPSPSYLLTDDHLHPLFFVRLYSSHRNLHSRSCSPRLRDAPAPQSDSEGTESDSDDANLKKSRNQKKREARRAVRWGMQLASFSPPQIQRILRVTSVEGEVFEALMLVKRLGRDVREGKRRQFNYIGRFLREVQPELMDGLIQATKDGDQSKFQALSGSDACNIGDDNDEDAEEIEYDDEEQVSYKQIDIATRWFDGLINKDTDITNEVYSVQGVDFDRQELRKLVREVQSMQVSRVTTEESKGEVDASSMGAKRSLVHFLQALAKQLPTE